MAKKTYAVVSVYITLFINTIFIIQGGADKSLAQPTPNVVGQNR